MFCNYCGKNFEPSEGFEDIRKQSHRLIRCEECSQEQREEEYDWRTDVPGRDHRGGRS